MKATEAMQPWASQLFLEQGRQDILARGMEATIHRGAIIIVAGGLDAAAINPNWPMAFVYPVGMALGVRYLIDCRPMTPDDALAAKTFYAKNRIAWIFNDVVERFKRPIPIKALPAIVFDVELPGGMTVAA